MEALLLIERVQNTIQLGESHFREFKTALEGRPSNKQPRSVKNIRQDIAEALVAFANADSGELLIGVEDDGSITGLQHSADQIREILEFSDLIHSHAKLPVQTGQVLEIQGKQVLFFVVLKGASEIYQLSDGRCVRRKDKETVPVAFHEIQFERQEVRSREYDRSFVDGAAMIDLDVDYIRSLADEYLKGLSAERYLQQLGLAEYAANGLRLRMAALLLFARDIQRWHPRVQVRILKVNGAQLKTGDQYNVVTDEAITGNIFELLTESWERLRPYLASNTEFGSDAKFEQRFIYPEWAAREALVNAITHRDYSIQNAIEIYVFEDRMEIKSPGTLLSTLTIKGLEALEGAHESRNVLIARVLRENKYVREIGEGIRRIFQLMEENDLDSPKLYSNTTSFSVTLFHRSVFTQQQETWLSLFKEFSPTRLQKRILVAGMSGRELSPNDISQAMNSDDRDIYDSEITGLRKAGVLNEFRKNRAAATLAREKKIDQRSVKRFRVVSPEEASISGTSSSHTGKIKSGLVIMGVNSSITAEKIKAWMVPISPGAIKIVPDKQDASKALVFVELTAKDVVPIAMQRLRELLNKEPLLASARISSIHDESRSPVKQASFGNRK